MREDWETDGTGTACSRLDVPSWGHQGGAAPGTYHPVTPAIAADAPSRIKPGAKATALGVSGTVLDSKNRNPTDLTGTCAVGPVLCPFTREETEARRLSHLPGAMYLVAKPALEPRSLAPRSVHLIAVLGS